MKMNTFWLKTPKVQFNFLSSLTLLCPPLLSSVILSFCPPHNLFTFFLSCPILSPSPPVSSSISHQSCSLPPISIPPAHTPPSPFSLFLYMYMYMCMYKYPLITSSSVPYLSVPIILFPNSDLLSLDSCPLYFPLMVLHIHVPGW